jgi:hypothetical protein
MTSIELLARLSALLPPPEVEVEGEKHPAFGEAHRGNIRVGTPAEVLIQHRQRVEAPHSEELADLDGQVLVDLERDHVPVPRSGISSSSASSAAYRSAARTSSTTSEG